MRRIALHMATTNGCLDDVEFLISCGVDLSASNMEKYTLWVLQLRDFCTEIIIHATQTQNVLCKKGRKIRELTQWVGYGVLRFVMESGTKGCEVIMSGKLCVQCAKSIKFKDGYLIFSGQLVKDYIDSTVRHVSSDRASLVSRSRSLFDWDPKDK
ncbi:40S ribosomal protein S3-3 [Vitis vinifera]|uniref:40S ribosomal protein S3-3 n=1 Tax=Vitis vinifera TaxID=29760 RepID=A0A438I052_VITVI|nr:40S ribosomal protein S3-3 [Vitis vinifera]